MNKGNKPGRLITTLAAVILSVVILFCLFFQVFPFRCLIKSVSGYDCPFCGAQRLASAMLNGDFDTAFLMNPFIFIISPYVLLILLCVFGVIPDGSRLKKALYSKWSIIIAGILTISWWIFRNTAAYQSLLN